MNVPQKPTGFAEWLTCWAFGFMCGAAFMVSLVLILMPWH